MVVNVRLFLCVAMILVGAGCERPSPPPSPVPEPASPPATLPVTTPPTSAARAAVRFPVAEIEAPAPDAVLPGPTVRVDGTAAAAAGVLQVKVIIKDRATGLWACADGTWSEWRSDVGIWRDAALTDAGATATQWSFAWTAPAGGSGEYSIGALAVGRSGEETPMEHRRWVTFTVE